MKNNKILFALILLIIFSVSGRNAYAFDKNENHSNHIFSDSLMQNMEIDLRLNYAFFAHHHFEMTGYGAHFPMFELSLQKQTYGNASWQQYFNFPTIGLTAFYSNFGNIDVLGEAYALYPFINFPFNKSKINTFGLRFGVGLGYITKKFDPQTNYHNTSIGNHFNAAISITFEYKRAISERTNLAFFAGLTHFSNGCSYIPNAGINIINAGLSASYMLSNEQTYRYKNVSKNDAFKKIEPEYYLGLSYGTKRIEYAQKGNTSVYDLEFYLMDRFSNLSKFGIGLDVVYDATDNIVLMDEYGNVDYSFIEKLKPSISLVYELLIGEASFLLNFGYHLYGLDMGYGRWFQKLGFKINIGEYLYGKIALNTHFGVADFVGFGLGIRL